MPYSVEKRDEDFVVVNDENGDVKGTHTTRRAAVQQLKALYANEPEASEGGKGKRKGKKKKSERSEEDED